MPAGACILLTLLCHATFCRLSAEFQGHWLPGSTIYIPTPTW